VHVYESTLSNRSIAITQLLAIRDGTDGYLISTAMPADIRHSVVIGSRSTNPLQTPLKPRLDLSIEMSQGHTNQTHSLSSTIHPTSTPCPVDFVPRHRTPCPWVSSLCAIFLCTFTRFTLRYLSLARYRPLTCILVQHHRY